MSQKAHKTKLCNRLSAIGLRQNLVHSIVDQVYTWTHESGAQWTIDRLKALKVTLFQKLAGNPVEWPEWVAKRPNGTLKGPLGTVINEALLGGSHKEIQRAISTLMIYSDFISQSVTSKQWSKFQGSVEKDAMPLGMDIHQSLVEEGVVVTAPTRKLDCSYSFMGWNPAPGTREPVFKDLLAGSGNTETEQFNELFNGFGNKLAYSYISEALERPPLGPSAGSDEISIDFLSQAYLKSIALEPSDSPVGKISFIQEPGFKLRAVANPHRVFQFLLDPLKEDLLHLLKRFPSDCTHDQESGVLWAQKQLQAGNCLSSVDLSDATNNFPLGLQSVLLNKLYPNDKKIVDLFSQVSTSPWLVFDPDTKKMRNMVWSVGQPLGLGPSFPSFAMSHHALAWGAIAQGRGDGFMTGVNDFINSFLSYRKVSDKYINEYRIVGDDIVMLSEHEDSYKSILGCFDIGVSKDKTITSTLLAEFASKVITSERIYVQNKWKLISDRSFLDLARNLGPQSFGIFRYKQQKYLKLLSALPEWHGGLGWNPKGFSLQHRLEAFKDFIQRNLIKSQSYLQKEVLALAKARDAFGDDFVYQMNLPALVLNNLEHKKAHPDRDDKISSRSLDRIFSITERKADTIDGKLLAEISTLVFQEGDTPNIRERKSGDPRQATVLSDLERYKHVLQTANSKLNALNDDKPVPKTLDELLDEDPYLLGTSDYQSEPTPSKKVVKTTFRHGRVKTQVVDPSDFDIER
jgi:hypothetical protein